VSWIWGSFSKLQEQTYCLQLSSQFGRGFHSPSPFCIFSPHLTSAWLRLFFMDTSGHHLVDLTSFYTQKPLSKWQNHSKAKERTFQKEQRVHMFLLFPVCHPKRWKTVLNSWEYPLLLLKRYLSQLVLLKGKPGQLPFAVSREWILNVAYGLCYGLFGLQHQQKESCNFGRSLKTVSSHLI